MRTRIFSVASLVSAIVFLVPLAAQAIMYAPGATLNPACAPTDPNCGVTSTVGSISTGTTGQIPYYAINGSALSPSNGFTVLSNGNVGIGTTTPAYPLDVSGTINVGSTQSGGPRNVGLSVSGGGGQFYVTNDGNATNLFVGDVVGKNTTGSIGYFNTIFGLQSGANIPDVGANVGHSNSFFGYLSGQSNTTGTGNVLLGQQTGQLITAGNNNTIVGTLAGGAVTTGSNNILIGNGAGGTSGGALTTGSNNVVLGNSISPASSTDSNQLNIGNLIYATGLTTQGTASSGFVGIGTTTPAAILDLQYDGGGGLSQTSYRNATLGGAITIAHARGTRTAPLPLSPNDQTGNIYFFGKESDGVNRLEGNISSTYISNNRGALSFNVNNTPDTIMVLATSNGAIAKTGVGIGYTIAQVASSTASLSVKGKVGIGTTTPNADFQIVENSFNPGTVSNAAGGTTLTGIGTEFINTFKVGDTISINNGAQFVVISAIASDTSMTTAPITNANTNVAYAVPGVPSARFSVLDNGNVGIGSTTPAQKLDVAGSIRQTGCLNAALSANASGDIICTSDENLKQNITPFTTGLEIIQGINPEYFQYNGETFTHAGFVAQNVQSVLPQATPLQTNGYLGLDTNAILAAR